MGFLTGFGANNVLGFLGDLGKTWGDVEKSKWDARAREASYLQQSSREYQMAQLNNNGNSSLMLWVVIGVMFLIMLMFMFLNRK